MYFVVVITSLKTHVIEVMDKQLTDKKYSSI